MKTSHEPGSATEPNPMDKLLAKLSEQSAALNKQHEALKNSDDNIAYTRTAEYVSASSSLPITPATETNNNSTAPSTGPASITGDETTNTGDDEVLRLKLELEAAKHKLARMDQELAQSRITKHTLDQAMGEPEYPMNPDINVLNNLSQSTVRPQVQRDNSWAAQEDNRSDTSDAMSASEFNRARAIWGNGGRPPFNSQSPLPPFQAPPDALASNQWMNRGFGQPYDAPPAPFAGPPMNGFRGDRMMPDPDLLMGPPAGRRNQVGGRFTRAGGGSFPYASSSSSYDGYTPVPAPYGSVGGMGGGVAPMGGPMGINAGMNGGGSMYGGYQPQPIGTPLSPHAPEFTSTTSGYVSTTHSPSSSLTITNTTSGRPCRGPDLYAND